MISKTIGFRGTLFSDTPACWRNGFEFWMITDVQNGFSTPTHLTPALLEPNKQSVEHQLGSVVGTRLRVKSMTWLTTLCLWRLSVGWVHSCTCTPWGATVMRLSHAFQMPETQARVGQEACNVTTYKDWKVSELRTVLKNLDHLHSMWSSTMDETILTGATPG